MRACPSTPSSAPTGRSPAQLPDYESRPQQLAMADAVERAIAGPPASDGRGRHRRRQELRLPRARHPGGARRQGLPRRHLHAHHQPAGAAHPQGHPVPAAGDAAAVPRRARQGPVATTSACAGCASPSSGPASLLGAGRRRAAAADRPLVAADRRRQPQRPAAFSRCRPSGTWSRATAATAWAGTAPTTTGCFYFKARKAMFGAQLLVVNHALFFSDLALRRAGAGLLPDYKVVIFDEAHTLEDVAADHLGLQVGAGAVDYLLNKLSQPADRQGPARHPRRRATPCARCAGGPPRRRRGSSPTWRRWLRPASRAGTGRVRASRTSSPTSLSEELTKLGSERATASPSKLESDEEKIEFTRRGRPLRRRGRSRSGNGWRRRWPARSTGSKRRGERGRDGAGQRPDRGRPGCCRSSFTTRCRPWS